MHTHTLKYQERYKKKVTVDHQAKEKENNIYDDADLIH